MAARIIELGQKAHEIDPGMKKEKLALMLQQCFLGTVLLWSLRGQPKLEDALEDTFQHFWRAIASG